MDDVSRFMIAEGLRPAPAHFLESEFLMGQRIETPRFYLTYRQEGERLILCDFTARNDDGQAVIALMGLLRRLIGALPLLRYIDAMILPAPHDRALDRMRRRLTDVMLAEGAQPLRLDDALWLRYCCR
ncbi:type III secretion protein [Edwardsiella piscicida]|uniref:EseE n=4 Tax=Edwardsiella TaxID=635 RepID=A0A0H3DR39_EDWTF|nr:type III secretion protein [Edwardsiella piscicida]AAV69406.1 EseE [Edwardsiella tarda]ACY83713.1 type III secretion system effector protein E [Edwardsiella tarda EIB202]ADM40931.1 EseE [Edwardsiella tarda FL6-60]AAX55247.1 EseE [Edwardsiella tarda]AGH72964.1 protein EseE [Edwardsiella piscicida C07-087]